ncbi:VRR-NUC domain-containing protein [Pseudomonas sp. L-22-4S-12]|uniref:VRR-NUC domain-containing protein n=1 Tax=Pseudomonas sp. L-22-4S-12 TaxID=2610893 RepID=UPI00132B56F9|nr:VRR-NUC domain-containing protein [Pseudomonas sp. L-22-4S-12]MWV18266.1 VRR-NUC domain-containing protein [Pseudomonas sp. L-22-4S-12]
MNFHAGETILYENTVADYQHVPLPPELYYLSNFRTALAWVGQRYDDLLTAEEQAFLTAFAACDWPAQALLVRMIMRQGIHFRRSKLIYNEIGDIDVGAAQLMAQGWLCEQALLEAGEIATLLRKDEMLTQLPLADRRSTQKKTALNEQLLALELPARTFAAWCPSLDDRIYSLLIAELCDRLRLMFFGNLAQDWSEFVLADLGIYRYEQVEIGPKSRGFRCRQDIDDYLQLRTLRERFEAGEPLQEILPDLISFATDNPHLLSRRTRLLFQIAQHLEKQGALEPALALYQASEHGEARWRQIRVLEQLERPTEALDQAKLFSTQPHSDEEAQRLERTLQRLQRKLGVPVTKKRPSPVECRFELTLPKPEQGSVEIAVRDHLQADAAPVHYVENTLLCSLFGLLCWDAIFAPLPGAFFHPFHSGPTDLYSSDFHPRRQPLFDRCLAHLDRDGHGELIRQRYQEKFGIQSPFVFWNILDERLLEQALQCIPARHLRACFERMLRDLKANRAGMPDLIQFYPAEQRYRMIEVKGPGDRLQDNQKRWLAFAAEQGIPVEVCYVSWEAA